MNGRETNYFDIKRDSTLPCFCEGCLEGKTEAEMSEKDVRYCLVCQPFVEREYALQSNGSHKIRYIPVPYVEMPVGKQKVKISTLNENTATVDNFIPTGRPKTYKKRELPRELIKQLHNQGMGSKAIASRLRAEQGIDVSYKTIQRRILKLMISGTK